ncbi:hypothetical protein F4225_03750 [Candidatus Poribacteria bacterium]|nr:hypothetical protein [Candidatus Poribacteria bacterium]
MRKQLVCILTILLFFITIQSDICSDNDIYNEDEQKETRYWDNLGTWKVKQRGEDSEDNSQLETSVCTLAAQSTYIHALSAYAFFESHYNNPKVKGTWYLRAQLHHDWATDEEPYEDEGEIKGKVGGMHKSGWQNDVDYWANKDPMKTIKKCDAYAEAKVTLPVGNVEHRSVSYSHFTPRTIAWISQKRGYP